MRLVEHILESDRQEHFCFHIMEHHQFHRFMDFQYKKIGGVDEEKTKYAVQSCDGLDLACGTCMFSGKYPG